jgi:hypothetical protein
VIQFELTSSDFTRWQIPTLFHPAAPRATDIVSRGDLRRRFSIVVRFEYPLPKGLSVCHRTKHSFTTLEAQAQQTAKRYVIGEDALRGIFN